MGVEIEHKFLVVGDGWLAVAGEGRRMRQGYLAGGARVSVRVRVSGEQAWLGVKQARSATVRREFEYPVPLTDAEEMLAHSCEDGVVDKTRYRIPYGAHVWEVDVFHGNNDGLIVAEVELSREGEAFERPDWLGEDVSGDPRYLNHALARRPYRTWQGER